MSMTLCSQQVIDPHASDPQGRSAHSVLTGEGDTEWRHQSFAGTDHGSPCWENPWIDIGGEG